ncbi:MAG: hypothetical protein LBL52_01150 [Rickettsiales bacterium]|jgi:predicted  nucleic acid-binding Zn-ribbon protein|nr:hypothetical protein [Rickettsiales bacterium]
MVKKVEAGTEYEVLHTKSKAKKIANIFSIVWILCAAVPAAYFIFLKSDVIQKYAIVRGVYETNKYMLAQYGELEQYLTSKMDINKLANKVKVPEVNVDGLVSGIAKVESEAKALDVQAAKISAQAADIEKAVSSASASLDVGKASAALGKLGVKTPADPSAKLKEVQAKVSATAKQASEQAAKVSAQVRGLSDAAGKVKNDAAKMNDSVRESVDKARATLATDFNKQVKDELAGFGTSQMQKALNLSDTSFKKLVANQYGFTGAARANLEQIYGEFSNTKTIAIKQAMGYIKDYWGWISIGLVIIVFAIAIVPVVLAQKLAKTITGLIERCPHCGKLFVPKRAKYNFIKLIKWW